MTTVKLSDRFTKITILLYSVFIFLPRSLILYTGPVSQDTFRVLAISRHIVEYDSTSNLGGILGWFEILPDTQAIGAVGLFSLIAYHSSDKLIDFIYITTITFYLLFLLAIFSYLLINRILVMQNFDPGAGVKNTIIFLLMLLYSSTPVVIKFTAGWYSGRTFIFILVPIYLYFHLCYKARFRNIFLALLILNFSLFHRAIALLFLILASDILSKSVLRLENRDDNKQRQLFKILIASLVCLTTVPLFLWAFSYDELIWIWMLRDLQFLANFLNFRFPNNLLGSIEVLFIFSVWFIIRQGWLFAISIYN
ncbi:MAG: hypothetical protein IH840_13800, partial [Candidatus Heimdallarchaeota archaeon]|nr:hypothetical protein [Candidatus Heimdallarchaeota archaeon]